MSEVTLTITLPGLVCPMPILKAKKALMGMAGGEVLKVVSTDKKSTEDFQVFCRQTGHTLMDQFESTWEGAPAYVSVIKRRH